MRYTVRPISDRTWIHTQQRTPSRFDSSWSSTLQLLGRELDHLKARDVVLEIDVEERHIRQDGMLYANARPTSSAVAVAFDSKHGPLIYRCNRYFTQWSDQGPEWQHNVRAIALTLEALRAVDRHGASASGEQYRGYKAIGSGPVTAMGSSSQMTRDDALAVLWQYGRTQDDAGATTGLPGSTDPVALARYFRRARAAAHPDRHGGDRTLWDQVEQAAKVLGVLS